jgi:cobyrinic acid a,c-diamide synthase
MAVLSGSRGFVVAAASSGAGKTTVACAICAALRERGLEVAPFKVGPDFVDTTYLSLASGRECGNLDGFPDPSLIPFFYSKRCEARGTLPKADIAVIEGVMGMYDGLGPDGLYSAAWIARTLGLPVILVVDARAAATSAAAVAKGFASLDPLAPRIAGVIANRVSGAGHAELIAEALRRFTGMPLLAWLPDIRDAVFPSRHLGLIPALERDGVSRKIRLLASMLAENADITRLASVAGNPDCEYAEPLLPAAIAREERVFRAAVARDDAFCFHYPENWDLLRLLGADITFTSPLNDEAMPDGVDLLILPGGYPEEFAARLEENAGYMESVREFSIRGRIYAECGGMMYLTLGIERDGIRRKMAGLLRAEARMTGKLQHFGYIEAEALRDSIMFRRGERARGHEFHYSAITGMDPGAFSVRKASRRGETWVDGFISANGQGLLATYLHFNLWSCPNAAVRLISRSSGQCPPPSAG